MSLSDQVLQKRGEVRKKKKNSEQVTDGTDELGLKIVKRGGADKVEYLVKRALLKNPYLFFDGRYLRNIDDIYLIPGGQNRRGHSELSISVAILTGIPNVSSTVAALVLRRLAEVAPKPNPRYLAVAPHLLYDKEECCFINVPWNEEIKTVSPWN